MILASAWTVLPCLQQYHDAKLVAPAYCVMLVWNAMLGSGRSGIESIK